MGGGNGLIQPEVLPRCPSPATDSEWEVTNCLLLSRGRLTSPWILLQPVAQGGRGQERRWGCGVGSARAPTDQWPLLPSISKPSDTVIYGSIIFYCCRYSRLESTSCRSRVLSIIAAISQVVKAINRGIRPILESHY